MGRDRMKVELWPVEKLRPYGRNPRKVGAAAIDKVAASIEKFGFRQPLVCDPHNVIIVGHTRFLAAKKLGLRQVPVTVADDLSPAACKAYRIADNRTGEETEWDNDLLSNEFDDLDAFGLGLDLTGFDPAQLAARRRADPVDPFLVPFLVNPFSVIDCRKRRWMDRRKAWLEIGVDVELDAPHTE
jgi:ParB-like chromosome segregation protein Spo0J